MTAQDSNILIAGFDEAGRGPLAGPVCAAAVILPADFPVDILNDSKKLSEKKRLYAETVIKEKACYGISFIDEKTIDEINILRASLLAMKNAFIELSENFPAWCRENNIDESKVIFNGISDGKFVPDVDIECSAVVKADGLYPAVMAASILAKTARDRFMLEADEKYPEYGYAKHKGYPTKAHKEACYKYGPSPIQRLSFKY